MDFDIIVIGAGLGGHAVLANVQHGLAVDLQGGGLIKAHRDLLTGMHGHHIGFFDVLSLKDRGEGDQGLDLALAVEQDKRNGAILSKAVLGRSVHHAATVIAALHGCGDPDLFIAVFLAIHRNYGIFGLIVEQKPLDSDGGIVHGLIGGSLHTVADLAAIAVDAIAHTVEEQVFFSVDLDLGQIFKIRLNRNGVAADLAAKIL